jgi:hypothetical protein
MEQTAFLVKRRQDEGHRAWEDAVRSVDLAIGDRVRILTGPLRGVCGVLKSQAEDGKWLVDAGEVARGVLICIRGQQLGRN